LGQAINETPEGGDTLLAEQDPPCTKGQVFHRQYRENEAKIGAKVMIN
jgi:hypothetical protein